MREKSTNRQTDRKRGDRERGKEREKETDGWTHTQLQTDRQTYLCWLSSPSDGHLVPHVSHSNGLMFRWRFMCNFILCNKQTSAHWLGVRILGPVLYEISES